MRWLGFALIWLLSCAIGQQTHQPPAEKQATVLVNGPTIIAFFPPVSDEQLEKDADTNEALSDFQLYASQAREPLRKAGVDFQELYVNWFKVRIGRKVITFRPGKVKVGYYFVAPDRKPRIDYGVNTDTGLFQVVREYFGISVKK